jgi:glycosyltransferase involved in cell wall biosynthesis
LPYIIGLCKKNREFHFHIISFEKKNRYEKEKSTIENIIAPFNIYWHTFFYTKYPPVIATVKDVLKMQRVAVNLHKKYNFSIVHCRSYIPSLAGLRLKKTFNVKFIFDMRGFWADERVDGNLWKLGNPIYNMIYKYFKKKEKEFLQFSDVVISLTAAAKKEMLTWDIQNLHPDKIKVIPCAADFQHFNPEKFSEDNKKQIRNQLKIREDDFVLTYLGSIGTWYMLDEMLDFFKVLQQHLPNSKFLLITNESDIEILRKAQEKGINQENISIVSVSRAEVPAYLSISNFGIFFIKPSYSKIASSPVKMGEFLAMNIPVVANEIGDVSNVITSNVNNNSVLISKFNNNEYFKAVKQVLNTENRKDIREELADYYGLDFGINKYHEIYKDLS